jgi:hypothetical protein
MGLVRAVCLLLLIMRLVIESVSTRSLVCLARVDTWCLGLLT